MERTLFSTNVRQCNFANSAVRVQFGFQILFLFNSIFRSFRPGQLVINEAYLCFRMVCANGKF